MAKEHARDLQLDSGPGGHALLPDGSPYPSCYYRRIGPGGTLALVEAGAPLR